ncbi:uncharacterized protein CANTADRAFT_339629 [Suhomyces tanzawaensis NRRL Y-17324]|uniref:Uncharacterized protein n=1 Tax=Suhomyces tanzawaensis NRRL Y-17324 TaxID=984487 RepID=A0A1E4SFM9_9ASCO|nr:uncharacterized protein CANTADRAFT_339629 [Suhomyces tanzawaensis NRRL Y-17324]ODV78286.1 hypothetical protein CANTADRAFT_339629 [Suhomyces tanzawaensis NRRL Y-17324]
MNRNSMDSPQLDATFESKLTRLIAAEIERARNVENAELRAQIAHLERENRQLRDELSSLKQTGARPDNSAKTSLRSLPARTKRGRAESWDRLPIKMKSFGGTGTLGEIPLLRSQSMVEEEVPFHKLPTQYSDDESVFRSSPIKLSPVKKPSGAPVDDSPHQEAHTQVGLNDRHREHEHEAENEPGPPAGPAGATTLQRREFVLSYYRSQYAGTLLRVNLATNPITEQNWIISDFRPNPGYTKRDNVTTGGFTRKIGLTRQDEDNRRRFYRAAGGSDGLGQSSGDDDDFDDHLSQMFDKFPLPPGFMSSEFPATQEGMRRRGVVHKRQQRRLQRRILACVNVSHGRQLLGDATPGSSPSRITASGPGGAMVSAGVKRNKPSLIWQVTITPGPPPRTAITASDERW